jgi:hypothetical protein
MTGEEHKSMIRDSITDKESWKRVIAPANRGFIYIIIFYLCILVILAIPAYLLLLIDVNITPLVNILMAIGMVYGTMLAIFKVMDEEGLIPHKDTI